MLLTHIVSNIQIKIHKQTKARECEFWKVFGLFSEEGSINRKGVWAQVNEQIGY